MKDKEEASSHPDTLQATDILKGIQKAQIICRISRQLCDNAGIYCVLFYNSKN